VRGEATVTGSGLIAQWTMKALIRAGYKLSKASAPDTVNVVCDASGNRWSVYHRQEQHSFRSLYDLSGFLRSKD
jgi:hypothetical protein